MKKTQLEDLANALGVSKTLVSMVLNGKARKYGISEKMEKLVLAKAKEMNYIPDKLAIALRTGKSNIIALVVADISNPFYSTIAKAVEKKANKAGYNLIVCSSDENEEQEARLIDVLKNQQRIDGLIVSTTAKKSDYFNQLKQQGFPFVLIDRIFENSAFNQIVVDNYEASKKMTKKLISEKGKRIGLITLGPSHLSSLKDRVKGYKDALTEMNVKFNSDLFAEIDYEHIQTDVEKAVLHMLNLPEQPDAIFNLNNNLTKACVKALEKLQPKVKKKITIASFDDIELFDFVQIPVQSIAQPVSKIGEEAVDLLMNLIQNINDKPKEKSIVVPTHLVTR